jgi:hypothetical protein
MKPDSQIMRSERLMDGGGDLSGRALVLLIKHHKRVGNIGIAERLGMGHD